MITRESGGCPVALSIAGSDSGGGAGIQADIQTFAALGVFGTTALTCVTAQNPAGVAAVESLSPALVEQQIRTVWSAFPVAAAKTGMLFSAAIIRAVAAVDALGRDCPLVVDPVMMSAAGSPLLQPEAEEELTRLFPRAAVVTPNAHEAARLWGRPVTTAADQCRAAGDLSARFGTAVLVKGAHVEGDTITDVLRDADGEFRWVSPRLPARENHGAGCAFSAALAAGLARGRSLRESAAAARDFVAAALRLARPAGSHAPLNFRDAGALVS